MSTFRVPGAYLDAELSDEGGHPVVQLHGLTSSRARDRLLDLDLGRGLNGTRLLRYDARGHGLSTGRMVPRDYAWTNLAEDLFQLLDHYFPGEQVHGVGPSMGTGTLLHAAVRQPERFAGLTLLVPPTAWQTRAAKSASYRRIARLVEHAGIEAFLAAEGGDPPPPATVHHPVTRPQISDRLFPFVFRGAAASDLPAPDELARLNVPVTILAWIGDAAHPVSTAERLLELLPDAKMRVARTPADVQRWPGVLAADVARHS